MSLNASLNIAAQGLHIAQLGLQVTGQNVANVNTEGYKRQVLEQSNVVTGGVTVKAIARQLEPYAERRLLSATSNNSSSALKAQAYADLEDLVNDTSNKGLSNSLSTFFNSLQDLADDPSGSAERTSVVANAESMSSIFSYLSSQFKDLADGKNAVITDSITKVNELVDQIADINRRINYQSTNTLGVNEMRNTRDECVRELAELVPVTVMQDENGGYQVYLTGSMPLVAGTIAYHLSTESNTTDTTQLDVIWNTESGIQADVTNKMTSGTIGGALEAQATIKDQMDSLDKIASEFVLTFNAQHRAGTGLDGSTGVDFFSSLPVYSELGKDNAGSGSISGGTIVDETVLTLHNYEIQFPVAGTYQVVDTNTGATVTSGAYTSGSAITFDGIQVTLSDTGIPPAAGDVFTVNTVTGAAASMGVSSAIKASTDAIAAGYTSATGDNQNALLLAAMQNTLSFDGNNKTIPEQYSTLLVKIGTLASSATTQATTDSNVLTQTETVISSVSGVSTDEEATNIILYQRAYQACAKVVSVTDEMMQSLINMV